MTRSHILLPLRQSLSRPFAQHPRNAFVGLTARRSKADVVKPEPTESESKPEPASSPLIDQVDPESGLPIPLLVKNELLPPEKHIRLPRAVQALYLQPLRRQVEYGVPTCDLQLRSYAIPNLEFFCDFALRAAYYLNLPAFGPVPLPRIMERWTVPKGHFIDKKSQENFERRTFRRLIQIKDGHPESVQIWLAFLQKHQYYGVGMKANVWEYAKLDVGKQMDGEMKSMQDTIKSKMPLLGRDKVLGTVEKVKELLENERFRDR